MIAKCVFLGFILILEATLLPDAWGSNISPAMEEEVENSNVPVANVSGLVGRSARLPCDTTPPSPDNPLLLVIWFKEPSPDPIYSFDVRGQGSEVGRHWNDAGSLGARARFEEKAKPQPLLWIEDLRDEDEGPYRCRVDFKHAPTQNFRINLQVIVPPGRPVIYNERGIIVETNLGPYNEGVELILTCSVSGGRPKPSLHWLSNGRHVQSESPLSNIIEAAEAPRPVRVLGESVVNENADVVTSSLVVGPVHRRDVDSTFTCLASNSNMTQASRATVALAMNLLPLYVHIKSAREALSADHVYDIHCITYGSRPSALVTWWLGTVQLLDHSSQPTDGGNVTSSTLRFQPKVEDLGKVLRCRAENPVMPASQIEDTWSLDINYLPRVQLRLGSTLDPDNIKEGDDVYFECSINAKPSIYKIVWKFNGMDLRQDLRGGIIMGNQSLVLQSLGRNATGNYYCVATNSEGTAFSNPVQLDIKYKPVCGADQKMVYGVAHGEIASINCSVKANPTSGIRFRWTFNSSAELNTLPKSRYSSQGATSQLVYSLNTARDYGTILCWAENSLGNQAEPCVFHLIPAVPPARPSNCKLDNSTGALASSSISKASGTTDVAEVHDNGIVVQCQAGFDGGLPQTFLLEVRRQDNSGLLANQSVTSRPYFRIDGLPPDTLVNLDIFSVNAKGRSIAVRLKMRTKKSNNIQADVKYSFSAESTLGEQGELKPLSTSPEQQESSQGMSPSSPSPQSSNFQPIMSILGGVATALVLVTVVIIVTMRLRCNHLHNHHLHHENHHHHDQNTWKTSDSAGATTENSSSGSSIDLQPADLELRASPGLPGSRFSSVAAGSGRKLVIHHPPHHQQVRLVHPRTNRHDIVPQPPPPPKTATLAAATLPRNFGQHGGNRPIIRRSRQGTSSSAAMVVSSSSTASSRAAEIAAAGGFMQLPSPPDPPSSFALSALSLDLPTLAELPSPPLDCDIVLPPPAESLYSLPRRPAQVASKSSSSEQLIKANEESAGAGNDQLHLLEQLNKMRSAKHLQHNSESVV